MGLVLLLKGPEIVEQIYNVFHVVAHSHKTRFMFILYIYLLCDEMFIPPNFGIDIAGRTRRSGPNDSHFTYVSI